MKYFAVNTLLSCTLAACAGSLFAQTPVAQAGSQPKSVGVTPQAAAVANQKAVPRSDVATVVRTSPTAADKARRTVDEKMSPNSAASAPSARRAASKVLGN